MSAETTIHTTVAIAGGGPAGVMLGFLLARQGIDVTVMEKHADFFRDFRGDTVHPSTLEMLHELGILDEFLKRPHQQFTTFTAMFGERALTIADFSHLPLHAPFMVLMPQWDFLDFLSGQAKQYPNFHLLMNTQVNDIILTNGQVTGLSATGPDGELIVNARLSVACDGRHSTVRERAGFIVQNIGAPIDVFWFRISRQASDPQETLGRFLPGQIMVMLNRDDYWQCAYVIGKGAADTLRAEGLEKFRQHIARSAPFLDGRTAEITSWDDVKLLSVAIDRLKEWARPGLLAIGDAAHAMSPIGGVGINLAVQDAVAAARILGPIIKNGIVSPADLKKVQCRREFPVRFTQRLQIFIQDRILTRVLNEADTDFRPPWFLRVIGAVPLLRRIPARLLGLGVRPEHIA